MIAFSVGVESAMRKLASDGDRSYDITHTSWPDELKGKRQSKKKRKKIAAMSGVSQSDRDAFNKRHPGNGCSIGRDDKGFYAYTHRARSKSYPGPDKIPLDRVRFVSSTG